MQYVIDIYECEWKKVVIDFDMCKCFCYFVNSDVLDMIIEFVEMCGQIWFVMFGECVGGKFVLIFVVVVVVI